MEREEIFEVLNEAYFSGQCHERDVVTNLHRLLRSARIFVDVGASLGQYTFFADAAMSKGEIVAVEADPVRYAKLRENCALWANRSTNRLRAIHAAAADRGGEAEFYVTDSNVSGGLFPHPVSATDVRWRRLTVPSVTLDDLFPKQRPDLVKIDVEGGELRVLQGARGLLRRGQTKFLIEVHGWPDPTASVGPSELMSLMASFGYRAVDFHGRTLFVSPRSGWWFRAVLRAGLLRARTTAHRLVAGRKFKAGPFVNLAVRWRGTLESC